MLYLIICFLVIPLCLRYAIAFLSNGFDILLDNSNADLNSGGKNNCDVFSVSCSPASVCVVGPISMATISIEDCSQSDS